MASEYQTADTRPFRAGEGQSPRARLDREKSDEMTDPSSPGIGGHGDATESLHPWILQWTDAQAPGGPPRSALSESINENVTMDFSNYGAAVSVTAPPADEVEPFQSFLQAAGSHSPSVS